MTSTILVTVIWLLADGTPAKDATVFCSGVPILASGSDDRTLVEDAPLAIDSRGAMIVIDVPKTMTCVATQQGQIWRGPIELSRAKRVQRIYLKGTT